MAIQIGSHYGVSRETVATINSVAARAKTNIDSTIKSDVFGGLYTINRWAAANIDKIAAAIATRDSGSSKVFATVGGISAGHFHNLNREKVQAIRSLDTRLIALGF